MKTKAMIVIGVVLASLIACLAISAKDDIEARAQTPQTIAATAQASEFAQEGTALGFLAICIGAVILAGAVVGGFVKQVGGSL